jgi:3-carboxy-cis,cis-muconate cycloisomerase
MPSSPADSAIYRRLFGDDEAARLFSDSAEIRAMLLVEGALARMQGAAGLIPPEAAAFIDRAAPEVQIDPTALAAETARNGVPVPALLAAFRKAAEAPAMMQYLHWGATSQDIMDTALALRLRPLLLLWDRRLTAVLSRLGDLADAHADLPMAARTYGQHATPTGFGAVVAGWGWPLIGWRDDLPGLRAALLQVSLSGGRARFRRWAMPGRRSVPGWHGRLGWRTRGMAGTATGPARPGWRALPQALQAVWASWPRT